MTAIQVYTNTDIVSWPCFFWNTLTGFVFFKDFTQTGTYFDNYFPAGTDSIYNFRKSPLSGRTAAAVLVFLVIFKYNYCFCY